MFMFGPKLPAILQLKHHPHTPQRREYTRSPAIMAAGLLNLPPELLDYIIVHASDAVESVHRADEDLIEPDNKRNIFRLCAKGRGACQVVNKSYLATYLLTRTPLVRIEPATEYRRSTAGSAAITKDTIASNALFFDIMTTMEFELGHAHPDDVKKLMKLLARGVRTCQNVRKIKITVFFPIHEGLDRGRTYVQKCNAGIELQEKGLAALQKIAKKDRRSLEVEMLNVQSPPLGVYGSENRRVERSRKTFIFS